MEESLGLVLGELDSGSRSDIQVYTSPDLNYSPCTFAPDARHVKGAKGQLLLNVSPNRNLLHQA